MRYDEFIQIRVSVFALNTQVAAQRVLVRLVKLENVCIVRDSQQDFISLCAREEYLTDMLINTIIDLPGDSQVVDTPRRWSDYTVATLHIC